MLKKAIGRLSCMSTAPRAQLEAYVSTTNSLVKFDRCKIGSRVIPSFNFTKAKLAFGLHNKALRCKRSVSGVVMEE